MARRKEDVICISTPQGPIVQFKNTEDNCGTTVAAHCPGCKIDLLVDENVFIDDSNICPTCGSTINRGWRYTMKGTFY